MSIKISEDWIEDLGWDVWQREYDGESISISFVTKEQFERIKEVFKDVQKEM